jgi:hypothetical protein
MKKVRILFVSLVAIGIMFSVIYSSMFLGFSASPLIINLSENYPNLLKLLIFPILFLVMLMAYIQRNKANKGQV